MTPRAAKKASKRLLKKAGYKNADSGTAYGISRHEVFFGWNVALLGIETGPHGSGRSHWLLSIKSAGIGQARPVDIPKILTAFGQLGLEPLIPFRGRDPRRLLSGEAHHYLWGDERPTSARLKNDFTAAFLESRRKNTMGWDDGAENPAEPPQAEPGPVASKPLPDYARPAGW